MVVKWTFELIQEEALKYNTKSEFKESGSAYRAAIRLNILDKVCSHMQVLKIKWDLETVIHLSKKCTGRSNFKKTYPSGYKYAVESGYMDKLFPNKNLKQTITVNFIKKEALKYKTRTEFKDKNPYLYRLSSKLMIKEEVCAHMPDYKVHIWSEEQVTLEASQYSTRNEFRENSPKQYKAAIKLKILDKICSHMTLVYLPLSHDRAVEEALKYSKRGVFKSTAPHIYAYCRELKILDKVCSHMDKHSSISQQELDLFHSIKILFPKTIRLVERKITIPDKPLIFGFEIDIYVPELRKGIEFDGTFHHSFAGLKRGRKNWPDEDIENYHQIKDDYFKSKGIGILHITEKEYNSNKQHTIEKCLNFLRN
jgi:DNA-binding Xre family transcriptional regulator